MANSMLVNVVNEEESRIAIVSEGILEELSIETSQHEQTEGNIYKGVIVKIVPSIDAVFVDYGGPRNGFLAAPDIRPKYFPKGQGEIGSLKKGQELMVQVRKGEIGQKGAALTTYVNLPGRYFVLMPFTSKRGVSRKIEDEPTRRQLRQVLDGSGISEEMGYIVRTAAEGRTKQDLTRDAGYLIRLWKRVQSQYDSTKAPGILYQDGHIVIRTIRDYFTPSIREVWVDDKKIFDQARAFFRAVMPWHQRRVKLYQGKVPLFLKYDLEKQIASIYEKTVSLPSGGSLVIEQTEALVSIDVNSGTAAKGKDIEETAYLINQEAAHEAGRQLRLRDLGGLVVIDFIDMRSSKHRNEVRKILQKTLKQDKARTETGAISKFGLLELSRQRIRPAASAGVTRTCPVCSGLGKLRSAESFALSILRMVQAELARSESLTQVLVGVPPDVGTFLLNRKRAQIVRLEADFQCSLVVFSEKALGPNQYFIEYRKNGTHRVDTNVSDEFPRALLETPRGLPELVTRVQRPFSYAFAEDAMGEPLDAAVEPPGEAEPGTEKKPARRRRRRGKRKKEEEEEDSREVGEGGVPPSETEQGNSEDTAAAQASLVSTGPAPKAEPPSAEEQPEEPERPDKKLSASAKRRLRRKRQKREDSDQAPPEEGSSEERGGASSEPAAGPARPPEQRGDEPLNETAAEPPVSESEAQGPASGKAGPKRRRRPRRTRTTVASPPQGPDSDTETAEETRSARMAENAGSDESEVPQVAPGPEARSRPRGRSQNNRGTSSARPVAKQRMRGRPSGSSPEISPEGRDPAGKETRPKPLRRTRGRKAVAQESDRFDPEASEPSGKQDEKAEENTRRSHALGSNGTQPDSDGLPEPKKTGRG